MSDNDPIAPEARKCGPCYACCIYLGIAELKKWPAQTCKYLDGSLGAETRCSIYPKRPTACQTYACAWVKGLGSEDLRPDLSGLLITPYEPYFPDSGSMSITITITDLKKCGTLEAGPLRQVLDIIISSSCQDIRIINFENTKTLHIYKGNIYQGRRSKSKDYEELIFENFDPPIGRFAIFDSEVDAQAYLNQNPTERVLTEVKK
jgi:Fe-S-cluster containining protein